MPALLLLRPPRLDRPAPPWPLQPLPAPTCLPSPPRLLASPDRPATPLAAHAPPPPVRLANPVLPEPPSAHHDLPCLPGPPLANPRRHPRSTRPLPTTPSCSPRPAPPHFDGPPQVSTAPIRPNPRLPSPLRPAAPSQPWSVRSIPDGPSSAQPATPRGQPSTARTRLAFPRLLFPSPPSPQPTAQPMPVLRSARPPCPLPTAHVSPLHAFIAPPPTTQAPALPPRPRTTGLSCSTHLHPVRRAFLRHAIPHPLPTYLALPSSPQPLADEPPPRPHRPAPPSPLRSRRATPSRTKPQPPFPIPTCRARPVRPAPNHTDYPGHPTPPDPCRQACPIACYTGAYDD